MNTMVQRALVGGMVGSLIGVDTSKVGDMLYLISTHCAGRPWAEILIMMVPGFLVGAILANLPWRRLVGDFRNTGKAFIRVKQGASASCRAGASGLFNFLQCLLDPVVTWIIHIFELTRPAGPSHPSRRHKGKHARPPQFRPIPRRRGPAGGIPASSSSSHQRLRPRGPS